MNIKSKIEALREALREHNYRYYVMDSPQISDYEFDMMLKELQELEASHPEFYDPNSPTMRVGGTVTKDFLTVVHDYRMYSLDNSYSPEDLRDWEVRIAKIVDQPVQYTLKIPSGGEYVNPFHEFLPIHTFSLFQSELFDAVLVGVAPIASNRYLPDQ